MSYPPLDITPVWARFNESLIALVDRIPDDQMNWSPKPELWNFRGILLHIADARDNWMRDQIKDGEEPPNVWLTVRSKLEVQDPTAVHGIAWRDSCRTSPCSTVSTTITQAA